MTISLDGLDKSAVLAALYNAAFPERLLVLIRNPQPMTVEEAQGILGTRDSHYFDYLEGRCMKIDLTTNLLETRLYNRDHGDNAAEKVIAALRTQEPGHAI